jgi:photosystem II stability/assembly factor-like uncharacterized protein
MRRIVRSAVAICLLLPTMLLSQWQQTNGPSGGPVNTMTLNGTTLFAGSDVGVCRSTDNGVTWTNPALTTTPVTVFGLNGTSTFAGTSQGVFRTTDNGLSWSKTNNGLLNLKVSAFTTSGNTVFVATDGGVFRSTDNGNTWTMAGSLNSPAISLATTTSTTGLISVYAGFKAGGIFQSTDNGLLWNRLALSDGKDFAGRIEVAANRIFVEGVGPTKESPVGTSSSAYMYSSDFLSGILAWSPYEVVVTSGGWINTPTSTVDMWDFTFVVPHGGSSRANLYVVKPNSWQTSLGYISLLPGKCTLCSGTGESNWDGITWHLLGLWFVDDPTTAKTCVVENGSYLFFSDINGVHKSIDNGTTWSTANQGISNGIVQAIALLATGPSSKTLFAASAGSIFSSTDNGSTWLPAPGSNAGVHWFVSARNKTGGYNTLAGGQTGLFLSSDGGLTWNRQSLGGNNLDYVSGLAAIGSDVLMCTGGILYRSTDGGANWVQVPGIPDMCNGPISVVTLAGGGSAIFAGSNPNTRIMRSTDNGSTWSMNTILDYTPPIGFAASGSALLAWTNGAGVYKSTDNGNSWTSSNEGLTDLNVADIKTCGSRVFASTQSGGVFVSQNDGANWLPVNTGLANLKTTSLASDGLILFVGTSGSGVLRYTGSISPAASLTPAPPTTPVASGTEFLVEVKVGDPAPINDLAVISFYLSSDQSYCTYVDSTATYGPFLTQPRPPIGTIVPLSLYWKPGPQTVSISLTWQLKPGMSGQGVVAKARFKTADSFTGSRDVKFSLTNLRARDSDGNPIELWGGTANVHVLLAGGAIWPGDCNNDGVVNAADVLPIGVYYGKTIGIQNQPGILWQGYMRDGWPSDNARKNLLADANGDGTVNSVDVLAIGLNYGKTHQPVVLGKIVSPQTADGVLQIGTPEYKPTVGGLLGIPIVLKSTKPVYGLAFNLKYGITGATNANALRLLRMDTTGTLLGGGLMLNRISVEEGTAEIGMTKTQGVGAEQGVVLNLVFDASPKDPLWVEVSNVIGNDEHGSPVDLAGSVYRSVATGANESSSVPSENALMQNYPNPLNPTTTIQYQLPDAGFVTLKVFDMLGREVAVLVKSERSAGHYSVQWDASAMPSGMYCYQMTVRGVKSGSFVQTRRMVLLK